MVESMTPPPSEPPAYDTGANWQNWKKQSWASRVSKENEKPTDPKWEANPESWKSQRSFYRSHPQECADHTIKKLDEHRSKILGAIESGVCVEARHYDGAKGTALQGVIDEMAHDMGLHPPPQLIIHKSGSFTMSKPVFSVSVTLPEYIETNALTLQRFLNQPERFKQTMAHELGHIFLGDRTIDSLLAKWITPTNQKTEILADRMGAIIHGNPREYAKTSSELAFVISKAGPQQIYGANVFSKMRPSPNGNARMLHKWADILEREGAACKETGKIIDRVKALEIFERSKAFAEDLLKLGRGMHL